MQGMTGSIIKNEMNESVALQWKLGTSWHVLARLGSRIEKKTVRMVRIPYSSSILEESHAKMVVYGQYIDFAYLCIFLYDFSDLLSPEMVASVWCRFHRGLMWTLPTVSNPES